jgi:hypothetical protein
MPTPVFRLKNILGDSANSAQRAALLGAFVIAAGFLSACDAGVRGQFAWASTDDRDLTPLERSLLPATEYRYGHEQLYFQDHETIWWLYEIQSGSYDPDKFLVALYENNSTPQPVEVDLRRVSLESIGERKVIRQNYEALRPGRYLLKIAHDSVAVDQVEFFVTPPGGPAAMGVEEELDDLEPGAEIDEIKRYSGVISGI